MRHARLGKCIFAATLIFLGVIGATNGDFAPGFQPVPESMPGRVALAYLTAAVCILCGGGLLIRGIAAFASRLLFGWLLVWLLVLRIPWMIVAFGVDTWWSAASTAIITATAWALYAAFASDRDGRRLTFLVGDKGVRGAQVLFGLGLIPIGLAHFLYLDATAPLVPAWMQWPVLWSYFTGAAFIVAGLAIIVGVFGRLAAILVTIEIALLTLIVWLPKIVSGNFNAFQWGEFVVSILLTACAWVIADSYRARARAGVETN